MIVEDLVTFLKGAAQLTALVGPRIYPDVLPQKGGAVGDALPAGAGAIVYKEIVGLRPTTLDNVTGLADETYQMECRSYDKKVAKLIAQALRQAMNNFGGTQGGTVVLGTFMKGERDFYDPDQLIYQTDCDFQIWHREP